MSSSLKIAVGSIFVGLIVLGLKTLAWYLTGRWRCCRTRWKAS